MTGSPTRAPARVPLLRRVARLDAVHGENAPDACTVKTTAFAIWWSTGTLRAMPSFNV